MQALLILHQSGKMLLFGESAASSIFRWCGQVTLAELKRRFYICVWEVIPFE
jgi:hypothetical protein